MGETVLCVYGFAGWESEFDERNHEISRTFVGVYGEPVLPVFGYTTIIFEYNEIGECVRERYYDADGYEVY